MVVCNCFNICMFILSRTARWSQYLINSAFPSFFWGCQKSALIDILKTPSGGISFNSWLRCYRIAVLIEWFRSNNRHLTMTFVISAFQMYVLHLDIFSKTGKNRVSHTGSKWRPGDPVIRTWKMTQMTHWPGDPMTQFHVCWGSLQHSPKPRSWWGRGGLPPPQELHPQSRPFGPRPDQK